MSSLFTRMRDLAFADPALNSIFGPTADINKFRWFFQQLPQNQISVGPCVRVLTVSQRPAFYSHNGRNPLKETRMQFDVVTPALNPDAADDAAEAINNFLDRANFADNRQFDSPPRKPHGPPPNFLLNQRGGFTTVGTKIPIPVSTLDYRILNIDPN